MGVMGTVTDSAGRILFVKQERGPFGGSWLLPGGGIDPGESAYDAVSREVYEETGIQLHNPRFIAVYEMRGTWAGGPYHIIMLSFLAQGEGEIPVDFHGHNVGGVQWAHLGEIALHSTDLRILTDAGLASFGEAEIAAALARDGITLVPYISPKE